MQRFMLKSKLHRATVTDADLSYPGSITIDAALVKAARFFEGQLVKINNLRNGISWETYVVKGDWSGGEICLNGPPARHFKKGDKVIGAHPVPKETEKEAALLTMGANGYGKKTTIKEYKIQKRGGSGIKTSKVTTKTGEIIASAVVTGLEEEAVAMSKKSQVIRLGLSEIPSLGRSTQGVRIMKLHPGDSIASFICL